MCRSLNTTLFILFLFILIYIHNSNLKHIQTNVHMKITTKNLPFESDYAAECSCFDIEHFTEVSEI